jgi:hypothetical protein
MKKYLFILLMIVAVFSCKEKNGIFKGEVFIVDEPDIDTLVGSKVEIDGLYTGIVLAYDSLIFFLSDKYRSAFGCEGLVFNVGTGKQIASIIKFGKSTNEFISVYFSIQYEIVNNAVCAWFCDFNKKKNILVDLSDNSWKKTINLSGLEHEREAPAMRTFILNDSLLLIYNQGEDLFTSENQLLPPSYCVFNYITNKKIHSYEFFNSFKYNYEIPPQICLLTEDRIKPDRTKLAMAMRYTRQINILDIESGKTTGYRIKDFPDLDIVRDGGIPYSDLKTFYWGMSVDDDLIYIIMSDGVDSKWIDVFSWDGSLKRKLIFDTKYPYYSVALDPIHKYLYTIVIEDDDEKVYRYDVNYLYNK